MLDLSGMTRSPRASRNYTKQGYTYLNGACVRSLKETVLIGAPFTLELRFPNGIIRTEEIMLVPLGSADLRSPRETGPRQVHYRG